MMKSQVKVSIVGQMVIGTLASILRTNHMGMEFTAPSTVTPMLESS